jgi:S-formylglutathione hydrolase
MVRARLHRGTFEPPSVGAPVDYRVITPDPVGATVPPLLLVLHGAGSSAAILDDDREVYEQLWSEGALPPLVVACASTPTIGGFYLDRGRGSNWETAVADHFPTHLATRFEFDPQTTLLLGSSMGGYGALRMAFRRPERYLAVATIAPAIFPGEHARDVPPRDLIGVLSVLHETMNAGDDAYERNHVVAVLRRNAAAIAASGLAIYVECGDRDSFNLHDGAEYLHRVLWDLDIGHEYRLLHDVDHIGPETEARQHAARMFLARALARRSSFGVDELPEDVRAWLESDEPGAPPVLPRESPYGPAVLRRMVDPLHDAAAATDPTAVRRYGRLSVSEPRADRPTTGGEGSDSARPPR